MSRNELNSGKALEVFGPDSGAVLKTEMETGKRCQATARLGARAEFGCVYSLGGAGVFA